MATEIPAAIRPYSMAVAPASSFKNLMAKRMSGCFGKGRQIAFYIENLMNELPPQLKPTPTKNANSYQS
jgi:hypothetical protein